MSHSVEKIALKSPSPGTERFLTVHHFKGAVEGPKVYLQAALHADEWPGMITLHHLLQKLIALDKDKQLAGEIVIVPFANPIGLGQQLNGVVLGRQSFSAEGNFNRNWPDLTAAAVNAFEQEQSSVNAIKQALLEAAQSLPSITPLQQLKSTLLSLSIDADIVLDLHCDSQALLHLYSNYRHQSQAEELAQYLKIPVVLLEDEPGGSPFDGAHIQPWIALEHQLSYSCFSATVELRGEADVSDELAAEDAAGLLLYLTAQGSVLNQSAPGQRNEGQNNECQSFSVKCTDLGAVDSVSAVKSGIICWKVTLGDDIEKGQLIAQIVDLTAADPTAARTDIFSRTTGVLFAQRSARLVTEGDNVGKIAGSEVLENLSGGGLLTL